jgi:hypothetical protein
MSDLLFKTEKYEILERKNGDCFIKDIQTGTFYFKKKYFASKKFSFKEINILKWDFKDIFFISLMIISFYLLWLLLGKIFSHPIERKPYSSIFTMIFVFLNIILHEFGHALTLTLWGRRSGKIRLKLYYIFPLVSVDTSDIYIMPKRRGIFVCYAGVMVNIYLCAMVILTMPDKLYMLPPVFVLILFSLIPFSGVKTDGYNLIVRLIFNINDIKGKKNKVSKFMEFVLNITLIAIIVNYFYGVFS